MQAMKSEPLPSASQIEHFPLVSCIMPTHNRRRFAAQAIQYFLRQDYPHRELIIIDDGTDIVRDLVPDDPCIHYLRLDYKRTIGVKRNLACQEARGEIIVHWDDDDWMAPGRLSYQVENLLKEQADICGLDNVLYFDPQLERSWQYIYPKGGRPWVAGNTLCYTKAFWKSNPFPNINVGEDTRFVWSNCQKRLVALEDANFYIALLHPGNISPKRTTGQQWRPFAISDIRKLMCKDWDFYAGLKQGLQSAQATSAIAHESVSQPRAIVTAASGLGDVLRITPLIRALTRLGYQVDVLLSPDYLEVGKLLEGAPEIHHLFCLSSSRCPQKAVHIEGLGQKTYDVAVFTTWSLSLQKHVRFKKGLCFDQREWLREGDVRCVEKIATGLGWQGDLPEPFANPSTRHFGLPPGTIALHPGCKSDWPWKKWHGFEELAKMFPHVVIIGTKDDLNNANTYFNKTFTWPEHAQNFVGTLNLPDTAALLRECAALVSNDSGIMHLGVALGIPTFGIFGITSPQREVIPNKNMFPITKGLPCEPSCRQKAWGRRDCEHHLECLKTLAAEEVHNKIREIVPQFRPADLGNEEGTMDEVSVVYYGYVFDASGYGHAARAYIHALHNAGITLSVVDLANHSRQVRDELVESLVGRELKADFHLFHGIPPQWARLAFRLPNAIGMTVWETDMMPTRWRNILSHVMEVWLPSEFNISTFRQALDTPIFKLPHAILPFNSNGDEPEPNQFFDITERDFVFYSLFEWQDRKSPVGLIESFLRAFPTDGEAVLIIKANPGAADLARQALAHARQQTRSKARVAIRCEAWSEAQIEALHGRGDCYVSLHRGEGWGYPLFEAASRGTPVIATSYSGPLEYLNSQHHHLVKCGLSPVRQPYHYYHPRMRWAEPDLSHATQLIRWVYDNGKLAKQQAVKGAERIQRSYSLDSVGAMARNRLLTLLKRTQPEKWRRLESSEAVRRFSPEIPIPATWYDQDYFETGLKSNWDQGYTWPLFSGLFRETAVFLTNIFSEATSYLDVGCAKGFLVRTLREREKECWGLDHSQWALDQAEESIKPFVIQASVDSVSFDRHFDVLLALSIFESLTESQALSFLSRARAWTKQAIFATIPSFQNEQAGKLCKENTGDLSHITIKSRQWWHELFLRAGWRRDPLHRILERICQTHELPTKMGWKVYLYAP